MKKHFSTTLFIKMLLSFGGLMLLSLAVLTIISIFLIRNETQSRVLLLISESIGNTEQRFSNTFDMAVKQAATLSNSAVLRNELKGYRECTVLEMLERWRRIDELFNLWTNYSYFVNVRMYLPESTQFLRNNTRYFTGISHIAAYSTVKTGMNTFSFLYHPESNTCSVFAPIYSQLSILAYVELEVDLGWFDASSYSENHLVRSYLVDVNGLIITGKNTGETIDPTGVCEYKTENSPIDKRYLSDNGKTYRFRTTLRSSPYYLITEVENASLYQSGKVVINRFLLISVVIICLAILLSITLSNTLTRKIRILKNSMIQIQNSNWRLPEYQESHDELDQLLYDFSAMARELEKMINRVRETEQKQKESELRLLREHINPHFIANVLATMDSALLSHEFDRLHMLINFTSSYLRLSFGKTWQETTLERELELVRSYWSIQQIRFGNKYQLSTMIDPMLLQFKLPSLILQTLVENALVHGHLNSSAETPRRVDVIVQVNEDLVSIVVRDNGIGMSEARLCSVRKAILSDETNECYGLWNVHKRVVARYGSNYGLSINSIENEGTFCLISIPFP